MTTNLNLRLSMSIARLPLLLLACVSSVCAAGSGAPELHGIIYTSQGNRFALVSATGDYSGWVSVGANVDGWTVDNFVPAEDSLLLSRDGEQALVRLRTGGVREAPPDQSTPATVAEADDLLRKMKFEALWDRVVDEQKKGIVTAMRQQAAPEFAKAGLPPDEIDTLLDQMGDAVISGMQSDAMRRDFVRIYTEVYTPDELRGMANFYDTATGQAWAEKQPLVQQKLMQVMMPRVMQGMPAAQKVAAEYLARRATTTNAAPTQP